ncbi:UNVERIFIED_ORG: hypothetical protein GGE64_002148 [Rhizobium etli]
MRAFNGVIEICREEYAAVQQGHNLAKYTAKIEGRQHVYTQGRCPVSQQG